MLKTDRRATATTDWVEVAADGGVVRPYTWAVGVRNEGTGHCTWLMGDSHTNRQWENSFFTKDIGGFG